MTKLSSTVTLELAKYLFRHCKKGVELAQLMHNKEYVMEIVSDEDGAFAFIPSQYKIFAKEDADGKIKYGNKKYSQSTKPTNIVLVSFKLDGKQIEAKEINKIKILSNVIIDPLYSNSFYLSSSSLELKDAVCVLEERVKELVLYVGSTEERIYKFEFEV